MVLLFFFFFSGEGLSHVQMAVTNNIIINFLFLLSLLSQKSKGEGGEGRGDCNVQCREMP